VLLRWPGLDPASPSVAAHTVADGLTRHPVPAQVVRRRTDPTTATGLALTAAIVLAGAGAIGVGALFVMVQTDSGFALWDQQFGRWGADHATSGAATFMRDVSLLGGTMVVVTLSVAVAVIELVRTRQRAIPAFLALDLIGITIVLNVVKLSVDRDRPDIHRLTGFAGSSFPSGHAATAAAMFAGFALLLGLRRSVRVKAALAGAAAGIATAVATTRVLLGVHWFTDVLAGIALGWAWFAVCSIAFGGRLLRFGAPVEAAERADANQEVSVH
jgi:undecaprenyl-diphosphatase